MRQSLAEFKALPAGERWELGAADTALADVLNWKDQLAESEQLLRQGADLYRKLLDASSPYLARNLEVQARLFLHKGDIAAASTAINEASDILRRVLPEKHPVRLVASVTQALVLNKAGRASEAEVILRAAAAQFPSAFPKGHYQIALASGALGECLATQQKYAEAEPILLESYRSLQASQGAHGSRAQMALRRLIVLYESWSKPDLATQYRALL